jgi:hypothetical protein
LVRRGFSVIPNFVTSLRTSWLIGPILACIVAGQVSVPLVGLLRRSWNNFLTNTRRLTIRQFLDDGRMRSLTAVLRRSESSERTERDF